MVTASRFSRIKCSICALDHIFDPFSRPKSGQTDGYGLPVIRVLWNHGKESRALAEALSHPLRHGFIRTYQHQEKLLAAKAGHEVHGAHHTLRHFGEVAQHPMIRLK